MKILFAGYNDWAGICNRIARAINERVGERVARVYTVNDTPFDHDDIDAASIAKFAAVADWFVSTGDGDYRLLQTLVRQRPDVSVAVTHAGTAYRQQPDRYNTADKEMGAKRRFIGCDSLHLAKGDPLARPYFGTCERLVHEVDVLTPVIGPIRVTHSPASSNRRAQKGTAIILPVLEKLQAAGIISVDLIEGVPPNDVWDRRRQAHVHVDQMNPEVGGFGQSAIEAMGSGNAVVADVRFVTNGVRRYVDKPPIIDARDAQELEEWLLLLARERTVLEKYRHSAWKWAQMYASPKAVADYWLEQLRL